MIQNKNECIIIGLTGGIASGKSTASKVIQSLGIPIIDADIIARQIVEIGGPALAEIEAAFGSIVLNKDGSLNRKLLGSLIFSDESKREQLNQITHPRITKEIEHQVDAIRNSKDTKILVIDAALLIEMNMQRLVHEVWLIAVEPEIQLQRLMARDQLNTSEALERIQSQMRIEDKKKYADVIINNNGNLEDLRNQIIKELQRLNRK
ncbi:MAG: dephospho-CoA kinase [Bacillota bacterium]